MLRLAVAVLLAVTISAAGVAQARMNVDADLCQPRSRDKPDLTHQLRVQTEWLEKVEGLARANALLGRARTYFAMADWDRAIGDFTRAEQEFEHSGFPKSNFIGSSVQSSLLVARGKAYRRKGDYAEAIKDFDSALALPARLMDPTSSEWTEAHVERGLAYRQMGRYDRAIEDFDRIVHVNPGSLQMARAFGLRSAVRPEKGEGARSSSAAPSRSLI